MHFTLIRLMYLTILGVSASSFENYESRVEYEAEIQAGIDE